MTIRGLVLGLVIILAAGCGPSGAKSEQAAAASATGAAAATPASNAPPEDLLAFASGTRIVVEPADADDTQMAWSPYNMIDEDPITDWVGLMKGPPVFVFQLDARSQIASIGVDTATNSETSTTKTLKVEVSDQSESAGFQTLLTATLAHADGQTFAAAKPLSGRWIRVTMMANGGGDNAALAGLRAFGKRLETPPAVTGISGTYEGYSGIGRIQLKQEGTRVVGCYEYLDTQLAGGIEGTMLKADMRETRPDGEIRRVLAMMSFADGRIRGFTRDAGREIGFDSFVTGQKINDDIGDCPKIPGYRTGAAKSQLETQISAEGRVRLDGVNFDFNSDVLQAASRPLLDQLVAVLKGKPDWKITLEGHTDNIGGPTFNKSLSDRRAKAVMAYLVNAGVPAARLTAVGFSSDKPVASNDTVGGRAQNRRVELVKN